MGLTVKAKRVLEMALFSGLDAIRFSVNPNSYFSGAIGWNSERNARRHLESLSGKGLIEFSPERISGSWVAQITELGKRIVLEEIDPEAEWKEPWDGKWRLISFDIPEKLNLERQRLHGWLKASRFGCLQGSLWISHRKYEGWSEEIEEKGIDPRAVLFHETLPLGPATSLDYVAKAWNFEVINLKYMEYMQFVENNSEWFERRSRAWLSRESELWHAAYGLDPFLSTELLPSDYKGKEAWALRKQLYQKMGTELESQAP